MEQINEQIQACINAFEPDTIKRMVIPYFWFSYQFTRVPGITFQGHDFTWIDCYDVNDKLIYRMVTSQV